MDLIGLLILLVAGWAVGVVLLTVYTVQSLTHPPRRSFAYSVARRLPASPAEVVLPGEPSRLLEYREWTFTSRGLTLPVWDIAGLRADGPTIIFTHGWGDSRIVALARVSALARMAARVILWDLPGHADAPGICTLGVREVEDLGRLIEVVGASDSRSIVLYGFSMGAGVSIAAAGSGGVPLDADLRERIRLVIAEAPYRAPITPAWNVLRLAGMPRLFNVPLAMLWLGARAGHGESWMRASSARRFDRAGQARDLAVPLLVLHGTHDAVCPIADGRSIATAAPQGSIGEIVGAGHLNLWSDPEFAAPCEEAILTSLPIAR